MSDAPPLPYAGIRAVEFMCTTCGMMLADLGAEVIKVEPFKGVILIRIRSYFNNPVPVTD